MQLESTLMAQMQDLQCPRQLELLLTSDTRGWVRTLLNSGQTVQQIMRKHQQRVKAAKDAGVSLGRDASLKPQDVRNCDRQKDRLASAQVVL